MSSSAKGRLLTIEIPKALQDAPPFIVAVGECMIELSRQADGAWRMAAGGDTFNTALYLRRLGQPVSYLTALGEDPFSTEMKVHWAEEGLDLSMVLTDPARLPGLYAIQTDEAAERTFYYWRESAAVRRLFQLDGIEAALEAASRAKLLYLSGITLSLFDEAGRDALRDLAEAVRSGGGEVAFDPNFRAKGWASMELAIDAINRFAPLVSIALPTFEDERALHGDADPIDTIDRWRSHGAECVTVKLGRSGCLLADRSETPVHLPAQAVRPVDTTGAGDSFNASFIAASLAGRRGLDAADFANSFAAAVIQHPGAIAPLGATPTL